MVAKELDQVFGDSDRHFTTEDSSKLKYLEACIKEGLRLYPSVPAVQRTISEDVELDGYQIPTGASINLSFYALHRNEDLYPEAMKFKPERFLLQDADNHRHPYALFHLALGHATVSVNDLLYWKRRSSYRVFFDVSDSLTTRPGTDRQNLVQNWY